MPMEECRFLRTPYLVPILLGLIDIISNLVALVLAIVLLAGLLESGIGAISLINQRLGVQIAERCQQLRPVILSLE